MKTYIHNGLEWSETLGTFHWEEAIKKCEDLGDGWRLPTVEELFSIVDYSKYNPASKIPGMMSSHYWSSSTNANNTDYMWLVYFYYGDINGYSKSGSYYVRAVRGKSE